MILDCENGIRERITRVICHYTNANNEYMLDYDKTKESSYDFIRTNFLRWIEAC